MYGEAIEPVDLNIADVFTHYQKIKNREEDLDIKKGICFGSSLCHGVFSMLGKLDWWKAVLNTIFQWDKKAESLSKVSYLPNDTKAYTLESLIQMAGHFLLKHETIDLTAEKFEIVPNNLKQEELLQPGGPFRIVTATGIKTVQDSLSFILAGHEDLKKFFNTFRNSYNNNDVVCLLHKSDHATALRSQNGIYIFNGNSGESSAINLNTSSRLYKSMVWRCMGQHETDVVSVDIVSFDGKINSDLIDLSKEMTKNALENLNEYVLGAAIRNKPELYLPQLLADVENNLEKQTQLATALLGEDIYRGPNGLYLLIWRASFAVPKLLTLVKAKTALQQNFVQAFSKRYEFTVLDKIIDHASDALPMLFELANSMPALMTSLADSFVKGETPFTRLLLKAPKYLTHFFALCEKSEELQNSLAKILVSRATCSGKHIALGEQPTTLDAFMFTHPEYFSDFLKLVRASPILSKTFAKSGFNMHSMFFQKYSSSPQSIVTDTRDSKMDNSL